jgi:hypothetical protein
MKKRYVYSKIVFDFGEMPAKCPKVEGQKGRSSKMKVVKEMPL